MTCYETLDDDATSSSTKYGIRSEASKQIDRVIFQTSCRFNISHPVIYHNECDMTVLYNKKIVTAAFGNSKSASGVSKEMMLQIFGRCSNHSDNIRKLVGTYLKMA